MQEPDVVDSDARKWALRIHASEGRSADSALAMVPPEEVETWAVDWLVTMQARGWRLDGAPVVISSRRPARLPQESRQRPLEAVPRGFSVE